MKLRKGFTLIELLIVITIIGILAVAFLPSILGAPSKARDTQRIADLSKLNQVLVNADLEGAALPSSGCINDTSFSTLLPALGGSAPTDPSTATGWQVNNCGTDGQYDLVVFSSSTNPYDYALFAAVENTENGNINCNTTNVAVAATSVANLSDSGECYAILTDL